ncbi:hypothetical protein B0H10DRAFT_1944989 [Mycena sp. CBHHK59/15]|nr:hypothetical protein B0H10DRAFT_1944989 [Mycena sp. CBHHK59/15]
MSGWIWDDQLTKRRNRHDGKKDKYEILPGAATALYPKLKVGVPRQENLTPFKAPNTSPRRVGGARDSEAGSTQNCGNVSKRAETDWEVHELDAVKRDRCRPVAARHGIWAERWRRQIWQGPDRRPDGHAESCAMVKSKQWFCLPVQQLSTLWHCHNPDALVHREHLGAAGLAEGDGDGRGGDEAGHAPQRYWPDAMACWKRF